VLFPAPLAPTSATCSSIPRRSAGNDKGFAGTGRSGGASTSLDYCTRALALQEELGDRVGAAATWDSIGYAHHHRGEDDRAVECYDRALDLYRRCGDRYNEADVLGHLGDTHRVAGRADAARATWRMAQKIRTHLG
jgi:tetratricopeptide (TPR) repeat protein